MNHITSSILPFSSLGKLILENKIAKITSFVIIIVFSIISIGIIGYVNLAGLPSEEREYLTNEVLPFFVLLASALLLPILLAYTERFTDKVDSEIDKLRAERVKITEKIEGKDKLDIFNTIQLSLNQLNEYYTINKDQARRSFHFSLFAIIIGLVTIIAGIWLHFLGIAKIELVYITGASGIILEFIGGAYFFMYNKSLEQVNLFFGQLIKIQDTMLSINLAENISDNNKKIEMSEKIITSLLERSLK